MELIINLQQTALVLIAMSFSITIFLAQKEHNKIKNWVKITLLSTFGISTFCTIILTLIRIWV